jgi:hypothetical protein
MVQLMAAALDAGVRIPVFDMVHCDAGDGIDHREGKSQKTDFAVQLPIEPTPRHQ